MKKTLTIALAFVLVIAMSIAGTVAYLTSSDSVTNTFSVGNIVLTLDEAPVEFKNDNGTYTWEVQAGPRVDKNTYDHLIPGAVLPKDPTIHIAAGSEDCYVGAVISIDKDLSSLMPIVEDSEYLEINKIAKGGLLKPTEAKQLSDRYGLSFVFETDDAIIGQMKTDSGHKLYVFMKAVQKPGDIKLFDELVLPAEWNEPQLKIFNSTNITISAYAVQASSFEDCYTAMESGFADIFPGTLPAA